MFPEGSVDSNTAKQWGYLAGLWHDLGKFSREFQSKLMGESISVEHSGAGAVLSKMLFSASQSKETHHYPIAAAIAAHHSGLSNFRDQGAGTSTALLQRLKNNEPLRLDWSEDQQQKLTDACIPNFPDWCKTPVNSREPNLAQPFFSRQLLSCLVDADSLVTEALDPEAKTLRNYEYDSLSALQQKLDLQLEGFSKENHPVEVQEINGYRSRILSTCQQEAKQATGVFSLNVPTGGGKTLSGMSFALRHAVHNRHSRVIVVAPYTTIIEQTADEYRKFLGSENVIEHHSNLDDFNDSDNTTEATKQKQLAAENWDAPIIVTTTVQFFESLFANKRSRCRKLHNIANSTVIIDEAQCLPNSLLDPTLFAMNELVEHYNCSLILSTATQPAFNHRPKFPFGFKTITPILPSSLTEELHQNMTRKRIKIQWKLDEPLDHQEASQLLRKSSALQKLIVVNTRKEASQIFDDLKSLPNAQNNLFHLSTNLCGAHRRKRLSQIKALLKAKTPCTVVSTQLIECGVDHSYQCVIRSMAGLDSLAQSAGRCNRHGENKEGGEFIVYESENKLIGFLGNCSTATKMVLGPKPPDNLANRSLYQQYFCLLYQTGAGRDTSDVLQAYRERNLEDVAMRYKLIDDYKAYTVIVPWQKEGRSRLQQVLGIIRSGNMLGRRHLRALQPYTISLSKSDFTIVKPYTEPLLDGGFSHFIHPDSLGQIYDNDFGLKLYNTTLPKLCV